MKTSTIVVLSLIAYVTGMTYSHAHSWYDKACCADKDCHPVNCNDISFNEAGDFVWQKIVFYRASMKKSQDGGCHVCTGGGDPPTFGRCIYMPSEG